MNPTTNPSSPPPTRKEFQSVPPVGHHLYCSSRLLAQNFCCTSCRHGHMSSQLWRHLSFHLCLFWFGAYFCSVLRNHPWWSWGLILCGAGIKLGSGKGKENRGCLCSSADRNIFFHVFISSVLTLIFKGHDHAPRLDLKLQKLDPA